MRASYGEPLRKWLKEQDIKQIIDFGDLPVFESATTYPCIFISSRSKILSPFIEVVNVKTLKFETELQDYVDEHTQTLSKELLDDGGWNLAGEAEHLLLKKLQSKGVPLGEYVKGKIYYGIKTGLNEAFVIDEETKKRLIKEDKKSAAIIKPFLAGRDIKRYQQPKSDKYLIFTRRGIDIDNYPAILTYLSQFKTQLQPKPKDYKGKTWKGRKPGSYKWFEMQDAVDYYEEFEKPKIIIPAIVKSASYTFDETGFYSNDKTSIISLNDKYLLGILNATACDYFIKSIAATKQNGYFEYKPMYVVQLPIPTASNTQKKEIEKLVDHVLNLNKQKAAANVPGVIEQIDNQIAHADEKINELVYQLYELTEQEIKIIES